MRRWIAAVIACAMLLTPNLVLCDDHVVAAATAQARLAQAASQRERDVLALERVLSTPAAASAAAALGTRLDRMQAGIPTLGDRELRDLAARAAALGVDPSGGYHDVVAHDMITLFMVLILVVAAIEIASNY